jgi:hypothetical protein
VVLDRLVEWRHGQPGGIAAAAWMQRRFAILAVVATRRGLRRDYTLAGLCPSPGSLPLVPGRLGGQLGAGGEVKLGEHVPEMSLHGPA